MSQAPRNFIVLVVMLERELPASVLLGTEFAGRGHHVWLIEKGRFRKLTASFAPSIVLEKGLTTGCLRKFRSIRGAGHILAVMCQAFTYRSGEDYIDQLSSDDLIAFQLQNARQPSAYSEMAAAMDNFQGPRHWTGVLNKMSTTLARKKMQKRDIELDEVNGLLQSYVTCKVRDEFVPAVLDEVGSKLQ